MNMATAMVTRRARKEPFPAMASSVAEKNPPLALDTPNICSL